MWFFESTKFRVKYCYFPYCLNSFAVYHKTINFTVYIYSNKIFFIKFHIQWHKIILFKLNWSITITFLKYKRFGFFKKILIYFSFLAFRFETINLGTCLARKKNTTSLKFERLWKYADFWLFFILTFYLRFVRLSILLFERLSIIYCTQHLHQMT